MARSVAGPCGHGGRLFATNMAIDPGRKLVTVWMVQHAGFSPATASMAQGAFQEAAFGTRSGNRDRADFR